MFFKNDLYFLRSEFIAVLDTSALSLAREKSTILLSVLLLRYFGFFIRNFSVDSW